MYAHCEKCTYHFGFSVPSTLHFYFFLINRRWVRPLYRVPFLSFPWNKVIWSPVAKYRNFEFQCSVLPDIAFVYIIGNIHFISLRSYKFLKSYLSQLMRLWYLSHRRPAKAQVSLRVRAVSPEPSLFANMYYGSRRRVRPKIRHLAPLGGYACALEE